MFVYKFFFQKRFRVKKKLHAATKMKGKVK